MPSSNAHSSFHSVPRFWPLAILFNGLGILIFLAFSCELKAQQQYIFTNYTQEQGLPTGSIRNMYKDTTGYIWLTSEEGVARFDGYNFKTFRHNPDDSTSFPKDFTWNASFTKFGDIYFGTDHAFCLFNPASESFTSHQPCGDSIKIFRTDEADSVKDCYWVSSKYAIFRISKAGAERFALPHAITLNWKLIPSPGNCVMLYNYNSNDSLLYFDYPSKLFSKPKIPNRMGMEDRSAIESVVFVANNYYLFTALGFYQFDSTSFSFAWQHDFKHTLHDIHTAANYYILNDTLVVHTSSFGYFNLFNLRTKEEKLVYVNKRIAESELNDRLILVGFPDHRGGIWMGTNAMGLIYYNLFTGELQQYIHEPGNLNSLPNNFANTLLPGENGVIWVGCFGHGLIKIEPVTTLFKTAVPTLGKKTSTLGQGGWKANIRGFVETDDGYWIATLHGLFSYSKQTQQFIDLTYLSPVSARDNTTYGVSPYAFGSLAKDHAGNLWIGTWYGELVVYNTNLNKAFPFRRPEPLRSHDPKGWFRNLFCDRHNRMWISTNAGVCKVDCNALNFDAINETKFEYNFFDEKDSTSLSAGITFVVSEDAEGTIWAGTENGLCRYNEQTKNWIRYYNIPGNQLSLHSNDVRSICLDQQGTLWIGTNGGGLNRYNKADDNFTHFTVENGLADDHIYSLVCDDHGVLWMGTNRGLCRFSPLDYSCKNFTEKDGIQNYEFNTNAALKLKDGTLLFGGVAGYNIINPDKIENKKSIPPNVVISSFKIFDQETPTDDGHLKLNYKENSLSFEFAALSYFRNQENKYAYKMDGVDDDWIYSGTRRYVSYSKLHPGNYTFHVKASNAEGKWNESGAQLNIIISPPWVLTWWAYCLYALLISATLYAIFDFYKKRLRLRRQLEWEHDEAIRLKELDTFKSQLFTNLTHEFRTPLTVILGMAKQLAVGSWQSIIGDKEKSIVAQSIQLIENNGKNLLHLINHLLDLSKLENKSFKLHTIQSDIVPYLRYITESFQSYAENINLTLRFIRQVESLVMDFDPEQIKQILTNLISNALKFTPPGGEVKVELNQSSGKLEIVVTDTGIGISEKDLPHILERFYQADSSNTRVAQGSGIGLAHTQELLKIMGGSISVESEIGKGTRVMVHLPIKHEEIVMDHDEIALTSAPHVSLNGMHSKSLTEDLSTLNKESSLDGSKPQLLIIEDSPDVVVYLKSCLQNAYQIGTAYNGKIGIEKALEEIPDLIISDVMMPEKDGYEVCDFLKNDERTSHIPIILLTAKADAVSRLTGLRRGADAYLSKPFDQDELLIQITMLLDNRRRMAAYFSKAVQHENGKMPPSNDVSLSEAILIEDAFIKKVNVIIEANYTDEYFSLPELCTKIGMSRSQLLRKIKAIADTNPSDLIRTYRLKKAKALLESGDVSVSEATYQTGFRDPSYFSKLFQEEFGVLPRSIKN